MAQASPIWTFIPGIHGTPRLFHAVKDMIAAGIDTEFIELPTSGKQTYETLSEWLKQKLPTGRKRLIIAESFSGPLAIRFAQLCFCAFVGSCPMGK